MASTQSTLRCHYRYDTQDRLINQIQPDTPLHQLFYCESRLATEIQGAMQHSIFQHGDLLLAQGRRQGDLIETTVLVTDLQRSVLHTLKANQRGQPISYCPYGHRSAESGLTSLLGFNGERPDPVTGHYLLGNGYRAFNPVLMRFNSPDSFSPFREGGLNPYTYCLGDPINWDDQTGRSPLLKAFMQFREGKILIINKRLQGPRAKAQLEKWTRSARDTTKKAISQGEISLKELSMKAASPDQVITYAEVSRSLRTRLEDYDNFNFNLYDQITEMHNDFVLFGPLTSTPAIDWNLASKQVHFSNNQQVMVELEHFSSRARKKGQPFNPSTIRAINIERERIRSNTP